MKLSTACLGVTAILLAAGTAINAQTPAAPAPTQDATPKRYIDVAGPAGVAKAAKTDSKIICKRDTIVDTAQSDWMEWQAGYVCGAILMPKTAIESRCREFVEAKGIFGLAEDSDAGREFIQVVMAAFKVSEKAARVRSLKLGLLSPGKPEPSLFS